MGSLWNRSGIVERYNDDLPANGAQAFFFVGGTTTPLVVYEDSLESAAHLIPLLSDSKGRWPDVFVPYITSFDVQVLDRFDVELTYSIRIPNPNPVETTVTLSPEQEAMLVQPGTILPAFSDTLLAGYVRLNGKNIGNAASLNPNSERANPDTVNLFTLLWNSLSNTLAPVSGGRGGSAAADYATNKTIDLPDCRGRFLCGVDDMGNTAANAFGALVFALGDKDSPASKIGANPLTLTTAQLPSHRHAVKRGIIGGGTADVLINNGSVIDSTGITEFEGGGQPINNMPLTMLIGWYIKL